MGGVLSYTPPLKRALIYEANFVGEFVGIMVLN